MRGEDVEAEARRLHRQSLEFDDPQFRMLGAHALQYVNLVHDRWADQVRLTDEVLAVSAVIGADLAHLGVFAAVRMGDVATARRLRDAIDQASPGRRNEADAMAGDAGIATLEGRTADARALYLQALRTLRELGLRTWLGIRTLDALASGTLDTDEHRRAGDEARDIFTSLRAQGLLELLDALAMPSPETGKPSRAGAASAAEVRG